MSVHAVGERRHLVGELRQWRLVAFGQLANAACEGLRNPVQLTEAEIKTLVVDGKWLAALEAAVGGEMDRVSQHLTQRVKELAERYETPLPEMADRVAELEAKVNRHLETMGFAWK